MPSYYADGLPPDLDAQLTAARLRADLAFDEAKQNKPASEVRRLLIERRIIPEIVAFVRVACETAKRGWLPIGAVEREVREFQCRLARQLCPDRMSSSSWDDTFQREVAQQLDASKEWVACRQAIAHTADALLDTHSAQEPLRTVTFDVTAADLDTEAGRRAAVHDFLAWCGQQSDRALKLDHFASLLGHTSTRQVRYWMAGNHEKAGHRTDIGVRQVLRMSPSAVAAHLSKTSRR